MLAGLTNISKIVSAEVVNGRVVPREGELWYRGYRVDELIRGLGRDKLDYEKIAYLLLMGKMPDPAEEEEFRQILGDCRTLPSNFTH